MERLANIKHDKLLHFFYGTLLSFIGLAAFELQGLWLPVIVGAWKEWVYDKKHGTPDIWDFLWTILPVFLFLILYIIK
jgi:hypothetical protein|tara:strand:- start:38 stop:271 length:234 start_codon:yes stop_codon:yes gene_type:complete